MNKKIASRISIVASIAMLISLNITSFVMADTVMSKEETVYVVTDSTGAPNDITVSEHIINDDEAQTINDSSDLDNIEVTEGNTEFDRDGSSLTWKAKGKDVYYQGTTTRELPVSVTVKYYLDGEEISGADLQGKSGDVRIVISYADTECSKGATFVVMTGLVVTDSSFTNINVSNGKVISDNGRIIVAGMGATGLGNIKGLNSIGSTVTITGKAKKFNVSDMMSVASSNLLNDLDTSALDKVKSYKNSIDTLDSSSKQLVEATSTLYSGLDLIAAKTPDLVTGVSKLNTGAGSLYNGLLQLKASVEGYDDPSTQTHVTGLQEGALAVTSGLSGVVDKDSGSIKTIRDTLSSIDTNSLSQQDKAKLEGVIKQLTETEISELQAGATPTMMDGLNALYSGAKSVSDGVTLMDSRIGSATEENTLVNGAATLAAGMTSLNDKTNELVTGLSKLYDGSGKLNSAMAQYYNEGISQLVSLYNNNIVDTADSINTAIAAGRSYNNYGGKTSSMNGSTKFVIKTTISK